MNNAGKNMHNDLYLKWAQNETDAFADACGIDGVDDDVMLDLIDDKNNKVGQDSCRKWILLGTILTLINRLAWKSPSSQGSLA